RTVVEAPLPTADPMLDDEGLDLDALAAHWADRSRLRPMTAEQMRGADARAQRLGVAGIRLMEDAGTAVGAAARALMGTAERSRTGGVLILAEPGNNGGDGFVAARWLAQRGYRTAVVLVSTDDRPGTPDARRNWDRLDQMPSVERIHAG